MPLPALFAAACLCAAAALAQQAPGQPGQDPKAKERALRGTCTEAQSRELFTACDADADDRLDVFETSDALETMRSPRDTTGFARLDRDRDGYVSWPEFDLSLRSTLHKGGTFRVRTARPLAPATPEAKPATPVQQFLQLHDSDGDGGLDPDEVARFLQKSALPPLFGTPLRSLDSDRSGRIDEAELTPWFDQLPGKTLPLGGGDAGSALLPPWAAADKDHGGTLDADELRAVLRRLDPALDRWAAELLAALDRNRDGRLQPAELPGAEPDAGPAGGAGLLPKQVPVR